MVLAPALPLEEVQDPTGAGDCFAGGAVGYLARRMRFDTATLRQAMIVGSVMASFNVEAFSLDRLRTLDHGRGRRAVPGVQAPRAFRGSGDVTGCLSMRGNPAWFPRRGGGHDGLAYSGSG